MKIRTILVDDEADSRGVLRNLIGNYCANIELVGEASNIETAYDLINDLKPDLVLLDIQMPGGNGFSLLKKFKEIPFKVIFITGYDQYALEAIKFSALHYLLKPVEVSDLVEAISRAERSILSKENNAELIRNAINNIENVEKKIAIHLRDQVHLLGLSTITHFEGASNYTTIYSVDNKKYSSSKNLGEYEELLENNSSFLRISKSIIINVNHIKNYSKGDQCEIELPNGIIVEVSRRKKQEMLEKLKLK
jgi:two-component system LytT family response regulator